MTPTPWPIPMPPTYGVITLDGKTYIERPQLFGVTVDIPAPLTILTNQRLTMPGEATFLLKGLSRDVTQPGTPDSKSEIFRFRIYNSEGTGTYFTGGVGIFDDRIFNVLCMGSGQFPYPLIPPIPVQSTGSLIYEIEDVFFRSAGDYPYQIHLGFHGAYLIPAD